MTLPLELRAPMYCGVTEGRRMHRKMGRAETRPSQGGHTMSRAVMLT